MLLCRAAASSLAVAATAASRATASTNTVTATASSAASRELRRPALTLLTFSPRFSPSSFSLSSTSSSSSSSATLAANRTTDLSLLHRAPGTQRERAAGAHEEWGGRPGTRTGEISKSAGLQTVLKILYPQFVRATPRLPAAAASALLAATRRNLPSLALFVSSSCARLA